MALLRLVLAAALVAVVGAVVVEFNLYVGLGEFARMGQAELEVLDADAAGHPHALVVGLNTGGDGVLGGCGVEVGGLDQHGQVVVLHQQRRIGEEEVRVCLQVDEAPVGQEPAVALQKPGGGESLARILHLRVAEGEPYLLHLAPGEEVVYDFDVGTQEGHVLQPFLQGLRSPRPHACSLDVDADEVDVGKHLGQSDGVFALAAAQLQHDGVLIVEVLFSPVALHLKGNACHTLSFR